MQVLEFSNMDNQKSYFAHEAADDLLDDEHLDDIVSESNETDNELINNLASFKQGLTVNPMVDSDVDSDHGSASHRFGGLNTHNILVNN